MNAPQAPNPSPREVLTRTPKRISITVAWETCRRLQERSDKEGRSISNLASFLLEQGLDLGTGGWIGAIHSALKPSIGLPTRVKIDTKAHK